jgi:hypothetical protein
LSPPTQWHINNYSVHAAVGQHAHRQAETGKKVVPDVLLATAPLNKRDSDVWMVGVWILVRESAHRVVQGMEAIAGHIDMEDLILPRCKHVCQAEGYLERTTPSEESDNVPRLSSEQPLLNRDRGLQGPAVVGDVSVGDAPGEGEDRLLNGWRQVDLERAELE